MISKKLGIALPWYSRSNSLNIFNHELIRRVIENMFLKQNILISHVYVQEYPKFIYVLIHLFPVNTIQYKLSYKLLTLINSIFYVILKKNIYVTFKTTPNLYNNVNVLTNWLLLKLYNEPSNIKKLLKQTLKQYDSITK